MVELFCDRCKENADAIAFDVLIGVLHNPTPKHINDTTPAAITHDNTHMRMVLCQGCYRKLGLPNIYTSIRAGKIIFRDEEDEENGKSTAGSN